MASTRPNTCRITWSISDGPHPRPLSLSPSFGRAGRGEQDSVGKQYEGKSVQAREKKPRFRYECIPRGTQDFAESRA
jgi:hypothetical protein